MNNPNRLRYVCETSGCFNVKKRPKIEVFSNCFPGKINFSDIDACVDVRGNLLMLEWKAPGAPVSLGQRLLHQTLVHHGIAVVFAEGDAETMTVSAFERSIIWPGTSNVDTKRLVAPAASLDSLCALFKAWSAWAVNHPKPWHGKMAA